MNGWLKLLVPLRIQAISFGILANLLICLVGCDSRPPEFPANRLFAHRLERETEESLDDVLSDVQSALEDLLGTPDLPRWPFEAEDAELEALIDRDHLARASGPVGRDVDKIERGLFRKHCAHCHGIDGGGAGPTAYFQNPYPRDFRRGSFKFKSTPVGHKPTSDDLKKILDRGIPGTAMPSFQSLARSEFYRDDVDALVDYVRFLSIRGETERRMLLKAVSELNWNAKERFYDRRFIETNPLEWERQRSRAFQVVRDVATTWAKAEAHVIHVPTDRQPDYQLPEDLEQGRSDLLAAVDRGRALFQGPVASCAACHGPLGLGDGSTKDFDEWSKDWTIRTGIDPNVREQWKPMRDFGALSPRRALPRNLQMGVLRGGSEPADVFRRIVCGIEGTPMPSAPLRPHHPQGLSADEVWDLVYFVLSLPYEQTEKARQAPLDSEVP